MIARILGLGAMGFAGYMLFRHKGGRADAADRVNAAYAENQPHDCNTAIRDAGPEAMRDPPEGEWTETDEDLDESFPASDPPGGY